MPELDAVSPRLIVLTQIRPSPDIDSLDGLAFDEHLRFALMYWHGVFFASDFGSSLGGGDSMTVTFFAGFGNLKDICIWPICSRRWIPWQVLATMRTVKVEVCHGAGTVAEQVNSDLLAKVMPAQTHDFELHRMGVKGKFSLPGDILEF